MRSMILFAAFFSAGFASAQESYTLKFKVHADAGRSTVYSSVAKETGTMKMTYTEANQTIEVKAEGHETVIETTVLTAGRDGTPMAYARNYKKDNKTEDGKTTAKSVEGKTLYFEKPKDGKPRIGIAGDNTIAAKETDDLYESMKRPTQFEALTTALNPGRAVRVGEEWTVDVAKYADLSDMAIDAKASSAKAKLAKVETAGQTRFGTFEIEFLLKLKKFKKNEAMEFVTPLELTAKGTLRVAIDGTSTEYEEKVTLTGKGDTGVLPATMKMKIQLDSVTQETTSRTAEKPATIQALPAKLTWLPAAGEWSVHSPKTGGFKVLMPGNPVETLSEKRDAFNDKWMVELDSRRLAYLVQRTKIAKADLGLKELKDIVAKQNAGSKSEPLKVSGQDAFMLTYKNNGLEFFHVLIVKDGVAWQVIVGGEAGRSKKQDREKFFESFELVDAK